MSKEDELKFKETSAYSKIKEELEQDDDGNYYFYGATTLPDRIKSVNYSGYEYDGEILSVKALHDIADKINDKTQLGGKVGAYRTISLFHDRVHDKDQTKEPAGFIVGEAKVEPLKDYPGHYGVKVPVEINQYYTPSGKYSDWNVDKIKYNIDKEAIGLSIEYNNDKNQETIVDINGKNYNYIKEITDFQGFGFARANVIGNPTAVRIKEIEDKLNKKGEVHMDEAKIKEMEAKLAESQAKIKEFEEKMKSASEDKVKELQSQKKEMEAKIKEMKVEMDEFGSKLKEQLLDIFSQVKIKEPKVKEDEEPSKVDVKVKEMMKIIESPDAKTKEYDWSKYSELAEAKIKENKRFLEDFQSGRVGIDFRNSTVKVKCQGRQFVVEPTVKTKELLTKTKDTIDANEMAESTYYQTNAFFADKYVPGIIDTFLKDESFLNVLIKKPFAGGNDKYQWKIWTEFGTFTGTNTAAVDPNTTSVATQVRDFIKLETPIREYRDAVEVTDFVQAHASGVVDLMGEEIMRAAEFVVNSMNADLFKPYGDATTGWHGFNGLLNIADSGTYTSLYGRTRSAANRLLDATTANTYITDAEDFTMSVARSMYEKVLAQGSKLSDIIFVAHPTQMRLLFDREDASIRKNQLSMAPSPASFGFDRGMIPYIDGIPVVRDYYCTDVSGNADTVACVDVGPNGFVLVVSKPIGISGLAKVGTSEKAYVQFWGQSVHHRPRNICLHDDLTTS